MNVAQINTGFQRTVAWEANIQLTSAGESDWIIVPDNVDGVQVQVSFTGGGSGKIQATLSPVATIKSGSPVPEDWDFGEVSTTIIESCEPVSALRAVQINAGAMTINMRAQ